MPYLLSTSALIFWIPSRIISLRVLLSFSQQYFKSRIVCSSARIFSWMSFGFSDFGLPVRGDISSPYFLCTRLLYSCVHEKSSTIFKKKMKKERKTMPLRFKVNILEALKQAGYNTTRIRQEALLSQSTLQKLRTDGQLSWSNIETICRLLNCQPGDILEYIPDTPQD